MSSPVASTPLIFAAVIGVAVVAATLATGVTGRRRLAIVLTLPGWLSGLLIWPASPRRRCRTRPSSR